MKKERFDEEIAKFDKTLIEEFKLRQTNELIELINKVRMNFMRKW